jgi:hypothetical protein
VLVAGERVTDQYGIGPRSIQPPIGFVGDLKRGKVDTCIEPQGPIRPEVGNKRVAWLIRFARCIGHLTLACILGFAHIACALPARPRIAGFI